jgi:peptide/nickel transport system permease protein
MLARAYQYMEIAPEQMYAPGLAILVVSLAFNALENPCVLCSIRP